MATTRQYDHLNRLLSVFSAPSADSALSFAYSHNSANERIRSTQADGSYWIYTYDALGQVTSGKRFWQDGTPVAGQQYEYAFDDIGNRKSTGAGGGANWGPLRQASYTPNRLNQYTNREVPADVDILGIGNPTASITVNGNTAYRKGEYFDYTLSTPNSNALWFGMITVHSAYVSGQTDTRTLFVARSPEPFTYDADGNLTSDGHWTYTWDAENRLITMETLSSVPDSAKLKLEFGYDFMGRRIKKQTYGWDGSDYTVLLVLLC
jgi:YD repeat-containing protein